jgi:hypothetical protein
MQVKLIRVNGEQVNINVTSFTEARAIVCNMHQSATAEIITLNNGSFFLIDEEGKLKNYLTNYEATEMAHEAEAIYPADFIVGDVILISDINEFDELPYE